jgi:hypothetical protein
MKSNQNKYVLLSCGIILIVACVCVGFVLAGGLGVSLLWPFNLPPQEGDFQNTPTFQNPLEATPNDTQTSAPDLLSTPTLESDLPDEIAQTIAEIESQVIDLRGLRTDQSVAHALISREELKEMILEDYLADYDDEEAQQDVMVLSTVGLLPVGYDLKGLYQALYAEQVAGFYDSESKEIYIVQGEELGGSEKLTYAHEYTHALQDASYGFDEGLGYNEDACGQNSERCAAINALIEGDASITEILWFETYATRKDYRDLMQDFDNYETTILDSAPAFLASDLYFPYEYGFAFVQYLYDEGGFAAVDAAYENLPLSTEQILHPERYPEDVPLEVTLPDLSEILGGSWTLFDQNILGEWYTFLILNQGYEESYRLDMDLATIAAEGWGGDAYAFYINEETDEVTFILETHWDSTADAVEFKDAFERYARLRWEKSEEKILGGTAWLGENTVSTLLQEGERTMWVISANRDLVESILTNLQ